jgi:hypothetical protein
MDAKADWEKKQREKQCQRIVTPEYHVDASGAIVID